MNDREVLAGVGLPLPVDNLDTDQVMPKQFLLGTDKSGLAAGLFHDLRFDANGEKRLDCLFNHHPWSEARFIVGGCNFGCGSSREHAVWGLKQWGIQAVLAPSFGEIFSFNCANNGLPALVLDVSAIASIVKDTSKAESASLRIDFISQIVHAAGGSHSFQMDARHKAMYLENLDTVDATLRMNALIDEFETRHRAANPWVAVLPNERTGQHDTPSIAIKETQ